ncbi:hypothetical protein J437_LFUL018638, partial [Ladona fulva]
MVQTTDENSKHLGDESSGDSALEYGEEVTYLETPVKSESDKKDYRIISLRNGLKAILISDMSCDENDIIRASDIRISDGSEGWFCSVKFKRDLWNRFCPTVGILEFQAAASLCVGVGSFSDPDKYPGLAHFLEHMVFMGSRKYPKENDFDSFIKQRGGSNNAYTEWDCTTFYFESPQEHLEESLDRFAQFFVDPLMKEESLSREREAIESEFQMSLPSDTQRKQQLLSSLAKEGHPASKFPWGDKRTLIPEGDTLEGDHLMREQLRLFHKRHYSAHRMTLAIQVELRWALPPKRNQFKTKPHEYVSWLIGHEGKGSLLSYLRKKVWALNIYVGVGDDSLDDNGLFCIFELTIILTETGLVHLEEVLNATFGYINMLSKEPPSERIFNELQSIEATAFKYLEDEAAVEYVETVSENLHWYPPNEVLRGQSLYYEFNPQ